MYMKTEAIYSKREADDKRIELAREHGGKWEVEKASGPNGRRWRVQQTMTRAELQWVEEVQRAHIMLDPRYDWFGTGYGSLYHERDSLKKDELDPWLERFKANPAYALSAADKVCEYSARYEVICNIIAMHEHGHDIEAICFHFESEYARKLEYAMLSRSTSVMHNTMERVNEIALGKYSRALRARVDMIKEARGALAVL